MSSCNIGNLNMRIKLILHFYFHRSASQPDYVLNVPVQLSIFLYVHVSMTLFDYSYDKIVKRC